MTHTIYSTINVFVYPTISISGEFDLMVMFRELITIFIIFFFHQIIHSPLLCHMYGKVHKIIAINFLGL